MTPNTSNERIYKAARLSSAFLYIVSQSSITGGKSEFTTVQLDYFDRIKGLNLSTPSVIGFGINSSHSFRQACKYASGAIIGSGFIRRPIGSDFEQDIRNYIASILTDDSQK